MQPKIYDEIRLEKPPNFHEGVITFCRPVSRPGECGAAGERASVFRSIASLTEAVWFGGLGVRRNAISRF